MSIDQKAVSYFLSLAYAEVGRSALGEAQKRTLCYGVYRFGAALCPSSPALAPPAQFNLTCAEDELPRLLPLYTLLYNLARLKNAELDVMLFFMFYYALSMRGPHDAELFDELKAALGRDAVLEGVLQSRYLPLLPADAHEVDDPIAAQFLEAFFAYRAQCLPTGRNRITQRILTLLAKGEFDLAFALSQPLLAVFPDNEEITVANLAARISLCSASDEKSRNKLLSETLELIDECLPSATKKRVFFLYYRALALMGLRDLKGAESCFNEALAENPAFEPAALMLKAMADKG